MVGRTVQSLDVYGPRTLRRHPPGPAGFIARIVGCRVEAACRRGKFLWPPLSPARVAGERGWGPATSGEAPAVIAHLGMSGQFLAVEPGAPDEPHLRARFSFTDGAPELRFVDQRTFGGLALEVRTEGAAGLPAPIAHIAPDPLEPAFDAAVFRVALRRRRTGIKRAL